MKPETPAPEQKPKPMTDEPAPSAEEPKPSQQAANGPAPSAQEAPPEEAGTPAVAPPDGEAAGAEPAQAAQDDAQDAGENAPNSAEAPSPAEEFESARFDPTTLPETANDGTTRYGIEIGTVGKREQLRPLWREFLTKHAALVAGLQPRRVLAPDKKWRLIAGPFASSREAEGACALFKKADRPCEATVYAGDSL